MDCPSYSPVFKSITVLLSLAALVWGWKIWQSGQLPATSTASVWFGAALGMMLWIAWHILRGRTTLDVSGIEQTWVWRKRVDMHDLAYAKLIRVPKFDWLFAPRLYTRTTANKIVIFYASSARMLQEFKKLEYTIAAHSLAL